MKPYKSIELPEDIVDQIGKEWKGTYTVHVLNAKEYLKCAETLITEIRMNAQKEGIDWDGVLPETALRCEIVTKAVTKDGKPLPKDVPSKLFEILAFVAVPLNMLNQQEGQRLFSLFRDQPED